jgi:hypothetical protein
MQIFAKKKINHILFIHLEPCQLITYFPLSELQSDRENNSRDNESISWNILNHLYVVYCI